METTFPKRTWVEDDKGTKWPLPTNARQLMPLSLGSDKVPNTNQVIARQAESFDLTVYHATGVGYLFLRPGGIVHIASKAVLALEYLAGRSDASADAGYLSEKARENQPKVAE